MDYEKVLERLKSSPFRAKFGLKKSDFEYIEQKGMDKIKEHAYDFVSTRLAPAQPKNDGKQTPMRGHPVFVAQHATATCCRGCLEKWHKIAKNRPLSPGEIDFVVNLIVFWIENEIKKSKFC